MLFIYDLGITLYKLTLVLLQEFNPKAKLWLKGRKNLFQTMKEDVECEKQHIWFHFASLGEFEQGRPVLEKAKKEFPEFPIVITFFSPSGYELRKNYSLADHIYYLPVDTKKNAQQFIEIFKPKVAIFTKYEYWYHYFNELKKQDIPIIVISAIFRKEQVFFKWYGGFYRSILVSITRLFVQDEQSVSLLKSIGIHQVTIAGDTRFDRVFENAASPNQFQIIKNFCGSNDVFIAGSTWPPDESLLTGLIKKYGGWKFIIAPHEIKSAKIKTFENDFPEGTCIRYSALKNSPEDHTYFDKTQVLIIDNIGMLSSLYQYGKIAYIGGGFGVGIHNTLEAAAFGVPVIFGPNYQRFLEAKELVSIGAGFSITDEIELHDVMEKLQNYEARITSGQNAKRYVETKKGATDTIISYLKREVISQDI